ncbi:MAG TPA: 3-methyl-2-oxobutanoate hydroxymethyltransferase [Ilumatobacter sp.]
MTRILDYQGRDADRTATVASIRALHGTGERFVQVTAGTAAEAAAAEEAGIEMLICLAGAVPDVRRGSSRCFLTAAIDFGGEVTPDDLLATALAALGNGADAVITARRLEVVELLAREDIPVMGHLGFVPKKSTLYGGVRVIGTTADEASQLWGSFRRLEAAGAFAVECELIAANVMRAIDERTGLVTISLGSGPHTDVQFLFMNDICGESERVPRHARAYADLGAMHRQVHAARVDALTRFRADVASGGYPNDGEITNTPADQLEAFVSGAETG